MLPFLNTPRVDTVLHVILVVSNPCSYKRRYQLARECRERLRNTPFVRVYLVELAYGDQPHVLNADLRLRCETPLWHKENMINLAVQTLLPPNWKAFAWVDADIQFLNRTWAKDALELLVRKNVIQLFEEITYLDAKNKPERSEPSCIRQFYTYKVFGGHSGFAWAMRRDVYEHMGGLYEVGILGGGDGIMSCAFTHKGTTPRTHISNPEFLRSIAEFESRMGPVRVGYIPGTIVHYFHGTLKNRKYMERWNVLAEHDYNPYTHLQKDQSGLLVPSPSCPPGLLTDILKYFQERNEDDWEQELNGTAE